MARRIIDLAGIAELLGVAPVTPPQWRQRSLNGELDPPLPDPDLPEIKDKPLWYEETIIDWAQRTDRWPPGRAARRHSTHGTPDRTKAPEEDPEALAARMRAEEAA